jgi:SAM-dependent methyltransferase
MIRRQLLRGVAAALATGVLVPGRALAQRTLDLDTPFVVTPDNVVEAMLNLGKVSAGDRLIDLGSGDGRIVIAAALRGARAHGVEIDTRLVARSLERAKAAGVADRATFAAEDLFETDFSRADVVTMYLLPDVNAKLAPKLYATLRPGARIVSHDYGLGDWPADARIVVAAPDKTVNVDKRSALMLWVVPAKLAGRWEGRAGAAPFTLELAQAWQRVSGQLAWRGREHAFADRGMEGERLVLSLEGGGAPALTLAVHARGDRLEGELREGGGAAWPVSAQR